MESADELRRYYAELSDEALAEAHAEGGSSYSPEAWAAIVAALESRRPGAGEPDRVLPPPLAAGSEAPRRPRYFVAELGIVALAVALGLPGSLVPSRSPLIRFVVLIVCMVAAMELYAWARLGRFPHWRGDE
jgi:hypothetical protein